MRPRILDEVLGQDALVGPKGILRRMVEGKRVPSCILWGPPGVGKTTLARLLVSDELEFVPMSAVLSGVGELRKELERAKQRRRDLARGTMLFVDEIHRWSKSQQDALLHAVEQGTVTLVGATTENPSFELNSALLSRLRVFVLRGLDEGDLCTLLRRALRDEELGIQGEANDEVLLSLARACHGDARKALNALEVAAKEAMGRPIDGEDVKEALQHKGLLYDKAGDEHYAVVSAFIKSMRGSDPDAATYYLVRMLEAGEDPRFLIRRMVVFASEDVGPADPNALLVATAALHAYELVGLPEGVLPMTQAAAYLAQAPKSNAVLKAYGAARRLVLEKGAEPVPDKLKNATSGLSRMLGHGKGYKYPHDLGGLVPGETYLPDKLVGASIWPKDVEPEEG
ncbi:MAG: replication-associated recombination protein A [Myxococcota bacterium]